MLLNTSTMEENAAPYSLQVKLLDLTGLQTGLLKSYKKGLDAKPSLIQIAGKQPMLASSVFDACLVSFDKLKKVHKTWMKVNEPAE